MQNYFGIFLRSNLGNLSATMKSACMASMYHICGYHDNCPKSAHTWCQYQNYKQDNTNYYRSKGDLPIDPGYYMTKCCRSVNNRRKRSSIYRMSEVQKKHRKVLRHSKEKKQQDKNMETEGTSCEK